MVNTYAHLATAQCLHSRLKIYLAGKQEVKAHHQSDNWPYTLSLAMTVFMHPWDRTSVLSLAAPDPGVAKGSSGRMK